MTKKHSKYDDALFNDIMDDPEKVRKAIQEGVWTAITHHKKIGNPICEWRGDRVVWIKPEDINV
ncbi:MAG: hypothetical protein LCH26_05680 [Proteobacteria bacterium]|nr:hypothetical protein [Pseudomonadota bacterium]